MSLSHLRFLNTRPSKRAQPLTDALVSSGVVVKEMPLLELVSSELSLAEQDYLKNLQNYDVVVCVSPMAAERGMAYLQAHQIELTNQTDWVTVGDATASVLRQVGVAPLLPEHSSNEGMLDMPIIQALSETSRVLIWRGEGGRRLLYDDLIERGVSVESISFYSRQRPEYLEQDFQSYTDWANVILITSGEAWQHWKDLCKANHVSLVGYHYVVLGERIYHSVTDYIARQSEDAAVATTPYNASPENALRQTTCVHDLQASTVLSALRQLSV